MTVDQIIQAFEHKRFGNPEVEREIDAYVAARMIRVLDHVEKNPACTLAILREHLNDDIAHWLGG